MTRARIVGSIALLFVAGCAALLAGGCSGARPGAPRAGAGDALPAAERARRPERLVLIAVPGLVPAHYLPAPGAAALAPQLAALAEGGVAVESLRPVFPPATVPALVSLVTGRPPASHGAVSLRALEAGGVGAPRPLAASAIEGRTLWQAVSLAGAAAASFDWPASEGSPAAQAPAPGSRAAEAAIAGADAQIGRLVACLRRAGRLESSAIVVAGDHGALPVHTAIRPNVALAAVGLLTMNRDQAVGWAALARSNGGSAFVYAQDDDDALLARRALEEAARETGVFRVVSAQEMLARGADPQAWFGLDAAPGWIFEDAVAGPRLGPASQRAAGGYAPGEPRMATGLVAWGAGFRPGVRVPELRQVDVAPTLALLLGVALDDAEGRALPGILQP